MNAAYSVIKPDYTRTTANMEPTRVCSVCGTNEHKYTGSYCVKDEFWLCPECLKRLNYLLNKQDKA